MEEQVHVQAGRDQEVRIRVSALAPLLGCVQEEIRRGSRGLAVTYDYLIRESGLPMPTSAEFCRDVEAIEEYARDVRVKRPFRS